MSTSSIVLWSMLAGCWSVEEQRRRLRVWEMQDHEVDAIVARDAIARRQLAEARAAGVRLARQDDVPGLPEESLPWLASVRAGGDALAREADLESAAARLLAITGDCAGCHRSLSVPAPRPLEPTALGLAWMGVVFESEERWDAGVAALGAEGSDLAAATSWPERRSAFAVRLASGSFDATAMVTPSLP
jgi:hypothetical protein